MDNRYQTGPPNWVFLTAFIAFFAWLFVSFLVIEPRVLRPLVRRLTGVEFQRVRAPGNSITFAPVDGGHGWLALFYAAVIWFIAVAVPIAIAVVVLVAVDWRKSWP